MRMMEGYQVEAAHKTKAGSLLSLGEAKQQRALADEAGLTADEMQLAKQPELKCAIHAAEPCNTACCCALCGAALQMS